VNAMIFELANAFYWNYLMQENNYNIFATKQYKSIL